MTPREQIIEVMAREICREDGDNWDAKDFTETLAGNDPEDMREHYYVIAEAALTALESSGYIVRPREATEGMLTASVRAEVEHFLEGSAGSYVGIGIVAHKKCDTAMTEAWDRELKESTHG